ncbi:uncharacterized protein A1O5_04451 [Cladophialophora psammophila CBS 110553]|uniref:WSC domain-containing protein n=1 Tax=Cladophialophora psammophila CBS 110553 TaxID=1182543 RepID=W9XNN3_9EURO|nr:uncharacterized protein A1O5_04451 [Cladophialophora psammophila CBS 110553]EXJ71949.1 hypothetical protein A1O5_04451 [Cladophialophora psammophila CBS 110553]
MAVSIPLGSFWTVLFLCTAFLSLWVAPSQGLDISYCSPDNNAGSYQGHYNEFQSNGACQQQCQGSFAFAVLQGYYCWCSNYIPSPQESTYDCNQQCPGFTSEWCGNTDDGLYGYYLLSAGVPLGTSGSTAIPPSSTSSPSSAPSSVSIDTSTSITSSSASASTSSTDTGSPTSSPTPNTWIIHRSSSVVTIGSSQSSDETAVVTWSSDTSMSWMSSTTSQPSTTPPPSPSSAPTPSEIYTSITTVTGEVRTVVVTPSAAATSDATLGQSVTGGGGVSTGKVVGIVLGVALGIGVVIGTAVYLWFRRRHKNVATEGGPETAYLPRTGDSSPSNNVPSRQVSQLSSSGLLGTKTPRINTSGVSLGNDLRGVDTGSTTFDRRSLGTDQRLNPYALYIHDESRLSNVSLQDNQDYSRQLRVANPDP